MAVSPLEWEWREWVLGEGRYKGRGARSQPRPTYLPLPIPKIWWVRLAAFLARRKKPAPPAVPAPFNGRGMVLLEPAGGTEDIAAAAAAGFTYLMLNLAHVSGGDWDVHRTRARNLGLASIPWQRIYGPNDVRVVEETANRWGSPACAHNLETEAVTTFPPANLASLAGSYGPRTRAVITEPWMQNGAGWGALSGWVAMPEAFMNTNPIYTPAVTVEHAHNEGCPTAVPMFGWGVWSDAQHDVSPATYRGLWNGPFAVYFGDGKETRYQEWR
jgi:hypothetical protein